MSGWQGSWRPHPSVRPLEPGNDAERAQALYRYSVGVAAFSAGVYPACSKHGAMLRMTAQLPAIYRCDACGAGAERVA